MLTQMASTRWTAELIFDRISSPTIGAIPHHEKQMTDPQPNQARGTDEQASLRAQLAPRQPLHWRCPSARSLSALSAPTVRSRYAILAWTTVKSADSCSRHAASRQAPTSKAKRSRRVTNLAAPRLQPPQNRLYQQFGPPTGSLAVIGQPPSCKKSAQRGEISMGKRSTRAGVPLIFWRGWGCRPVRSGSVAPFRVGSSKRQTSGPDVRDTLDRYAAGQSGG
jgi:hypothetical protein